RVLPLRRRGRTYSGICLSRVALRRRQHCDGFAIVNRYYCAPAQLPPPTIEDKPNYNMGPVKFATVAAVVWGIAGFSVGLGAALELAFPALNFDLPWISFGRIRQLHTSAVIFAFGGNVLVATSFYVVQRTC